MSGLTGNVASDAEASHAIEGISRIVRQFAETLLDKRLGAHQVFVLREAVRQSAGCPRANRPVGEAASHLICLFDKHPSLSDLILGRVAFSDPHQEIGAAQGVRRVVFFGHLRGSRQ